MYALSSSSNTRNYFLPQKHCLSVLTVPTQEVSSPSKSLVPHRCDQFREGSEGLSLHLLSGSTLSPHRQTVSSVLLVCLTLLRESCSEESSLSLQHHPGVSTQLQCGPCFMLPLVVARGSALSLQIQIYLIPGGDPCL